MTTPTHLYFIHALSPVHMGTGASTGGIDLPLARETATTWPYIPGTGLKGVLRSQDLGLSDNEVGWLFGPKWDANTDRGQGALMFSDCRLLCLPVRSYVGGWAWVTSPMALQAYMREARWASNTPGQLAVPKALPAGPGDDDTFAMSSQTVLSVNDQVFLHDIKLRASSATPAQPPQSNLTHEWGAHLAERIFGDDPQAENSFKERLLLVSDPVLAYLAKVGMDVRTRNRLGARKAVTKSGPWVEESLPVETLLWGSVCADPIQRPWQEPKSAADAVDRFVGSVGPKRRLQVGGKATVGRGVVHLSSSAREVPRG